MRNEEKLLAVARYLEGDMEMVDKNDFEVLLRDDVELQELLAEYENIHLTLKMHLAPTAADQEVESSLKDFNATYFKPTASVRFFKPYMKWISIAAILVVGLLVWAPWSVSLYDKYSITKEISVAERGAEQQTELDKAAALYNAKEYQAASELLKKEYVLQPSNAYVAYYYGAALIENDKVDEARRILAKLYAGSSVFKYDAAYTIALSYVKQSDERLAKEWLMKIPSGTVNYEKAKELINKL